MIGAPSIKRLGDSTIRFAGVDPNDLRDPDGKTLIADRVRYQGMGLSVLITSTFAVFAMPMALTVMSGHFSWIYVIAGLLYGVFILNFDRWVVSGFDYDSGWKARLRAAAGLMIRLPIALLIALSISEPIVMFVFASEIHAQVIEHKHQEKIDQADKLRNDPLYDPHRSEQFAALNRANDAVKNTRDTLDAAEKALDLEQGGAGGTGHSGYGDRTSERRAVRTKAAEAFDSAVSTQVEAQNNYNGKSAELAAARQAAIEASDRRIDERVAGLADRERALAAISHDPAVAKTTLVMRGLLFLVDVAPLLLKYAMPATFYEQMLRARGRRLLDRHTEDLQATEELAKERRVLENATARYKLNQQAIVDEEKIARDSDLELRKVIAEHTRQVVTSGYERLHDVGTLDPPRRNPSRPPAVGPQPARHPAPRPGPTPHDDIHDDPDLPTNPDPHDVPNDGRSQVVGERWAIKDALTKPRSDHPWRRAYLAKDLLKKEKGDCVLKRVDQPYKGQRISMGLNELHSLPEGREISPYVAPMVHGGYDVNFGLFVVTPYYKRGTLAELMRDGAESLTLRTALKYIEQILQGLLAVFEYSNTIHFDIKPSNIALDKKGNIRIIDWGLATSSDTADSAPVGFSLWYAPPEQVTATERNQEWRSGRCDIRAVGATLYTLIVGSAPLYLEAANLQLLDEHGVLPDDRKHEFIRLLKTTQPVPLDAFFSINEGWDREQLLPLSNLVAQWLDPDPTVRAPGSQSAQRVALDDLLRVLEQLGRSKSSALDRQIGSKHLVQRPLVPVDTPSDVFARIATRSETRSTIWRTGSQRQELGEPDAFIDEEASS
ncbi:DUF4407 domain-containing protein [Nocardia asiatica]|uniref:DUF4407 domain-containing protein n=1 Tax=Nocardia asiatica TaxID=209252 RepID=UPI0003110224|nr:DUF4407 domain-containing protein [Nocardia asiatica]